MKLRRKPSSSRRASRGFTLVEVGVCVVIVGVMLAAAMQTLATSSVGQYKIAERARGTELAHALMNEVLQQAYSEPSGSGSPPGPTPPTPPPAPPAGPPTPPGPAGLGAEAGEVRATFDDVDDYNGLVENGPKTKDGIARLGAGATWKRTVAVTWVNPLTLADMSPQVESGLKRITVTVSHNGVPVTTLVAMKGNAP